MSFRFRFLPLNTCKQSAMLIAMLQNNSRSVVSLCIIMLWSYVRHIPAAAAWLAEEMWDCKNISFRVRMSDCKLTFDYIISCSSVCHIPHLHIKKWNISSPLTHEIFSVHQLPLLLALDWHWCRDVFPWHWHDSALLHHQMVTTLTIVYHINEHNHHYLINLYAPIDTKMACR